MADTYCGKSCAECMCKEELNCPGCRAGPGRAWSGDCELSRCVRDKGHETCETCGFHDRCGTLASRERIPANRINKIEAEKLREEAIARRAPVLGKWLWILFWLVIPGSVAGLMTAEPVVRVLPGLALPGNLLALACNLVWGAILLKLGSEEDGYRVAGICALITAVANALAILLPAAAEEAGWIFLITLPAAIAGFVGIYREYTAHADVLIGVDNDLSTKWEKLWKWYIGTLLGLLGSILLMVIAPVLAMLVILAAAIGVIVLSILRLVYLYKTAKAFRNYC